MDAAPAFPSLSTCCRLAGLAYASVDSLCDGLRALGFGQVSRTYDPLTDTGCYTALDATGTLVWGWRGTQSLRDAETDLAAALTGYPEGVRRVHRGFLDGYNHATTIMRRTPGRLKAKRLLVVGHSLGGALATLCAFNEAHIFPAWPSIAVRTFGCPRVGDARFTHAFNQAVPNAIRVVHGPDIVPRLPAPICYRHHQSLLHLDSRGCVITGTQSFIQRILAFDQQAISDIDGVALAAHHIDTYQAAVDAYESD